MPLAWRFADYQSSSYVFVLTRLLACFKVSTGDVEDAPALDPLAKFKVIEKDGAVYIQGEEKNIKNQRRFLSIKCAAKGQERVLIIGSGSGAVGAIEGLRAGGYDGHMTVISREKTIPIDRTKLSKALITDQSKVAWRSPDFYKEGSVDFVWSNVTGVDLSSRKVSTEDGQEYNYTNCLLYTSPSPRD